MENLAVSLRKIIRVTPPARGAMDYLRVQLSLVVSGSRRITRGEVSEHWLNRHMTSKATL